MMEAIKSEDTFWFSNQCGFAQPNIYATKSEALKKLVELIEESLRKDPENYADYYTPILKRVRTTLNKLVKSAL